MLVAATEKGVCAIMLGDDPDRWCATCRTAFRARNLSRRRRRIRAHGRGVVGLVEAPGQRLDLPLDIRGTAFQQRVWAALSAIPPGKTATYKEIARAIGQPKAVRAVAQACGANPLAVAIPCHRVVRTDGDLSGYRWGVRAQARADRAGGGVMKSPAPTPLSSRPIS